MGRLATVFFVMLTLVFALGFALFAGPYVELGLITRGQFAGLALMVVSWYVTRWLISGKLK